MSADGEGNILIWDVNENMPQQIMSHGENTQVWDAGWNHMGTLLATCGGDRLVKLWSDSTMISNDHK